MDDPVISEDSDSSSFAARFFNALHRYKKLIFSYWWILIITVGIGLGVQEYFLKHSILSYLSTGRMTVSVKLSIPNANLYSEELDNFLETQKALMLSESVRNRVMPRIAATVPALNVSPTRIDVSLSPKTDIFDLTAIGIDARYTQVYLQYTMEEYVNLKQKMLSDATLTTRASIEDELSKVEAELEKSKQDVINYQSNNSVVFLVGNSAADRLADLTSELANERTELHLLQTLTLDENLQRQQGIFEQPSSLPPPVTENPQPASGPNAAPDQNTPPPASSNPRPTAAENNGGTMPSNLGDFEASYLQAKQQILLLEVKRDEMAEYLKPKHPDMILINQQISTETNYLEIYKGQSQAQLKNQEHILTLKISDLENQIADQKPKAIDTSEKLAVYEALKQDQARTQSEYDQLQSTLQTVEADSGISQEGVVIFEPATPSIPLPPQSAKHLGMAGLIGFILGLGIMIFLDRLDDRPTSFSEMKKLFDEPILGQIPLVKVKNKKKGVPLLEWDDERHRLVEAFRNLRSAFVFKESVQNHPKSIVITSAIPDDGKSMTAANLAITLARTGEKVLLVDSDLRRGVLHKHFSVAATPGLAEVFAGKCAWTDAVVQTSIPNLSLLPCGAPPRHPGGLFASGSEKFLKEIAAAQYDYYLFDTAPVMATDDVSNLAPHMDGVMMVVRSGFTSGRVARAALDLLYLRRVKVMGLVFNAVRPNASEYYYYRYKDYYAENPAA